MSKKIPTIEEKLKQLTKGFENRGVVAIEFNPQNRLTDTVAEYLGLVYERTWMSQEDVDKMVELSTIVEIQLETFLKTRPNRLILSHDLDIALDKALIIAGLV